MMRVRRRSPCPPEASSRLLGLEKLHLEDESRIWRDHATGSLLAISELGGNRKLAFSAHAHRGHTLVPSLDDLAASQHKAEGFVAIEGAVKFRSIRQPSGIVHDYCLTGFGLRT